MPSLPLVRSIILWSSNLFTLVVLGLCAFELGFFLEFDNSFVPSPALGLATSILHLVSVLPMVITAFFRDGAFTSRLVVEVSWLSFLWTMWLATGILFVAMRAGLIVFVFCFILWAMLFGYVIALICFAVRASRAGHNIWMTDVKQVRWLERTVKSEKPNPASPHPKVATYPPGGHPDNTASPVTPQPQYYLLSANPGVMGSPVTLQLPQYSPQQGGGYNPSIPVLVF